MPIRSANPIIGANNGFHAIVGCAVRSVRITHTDKRTVAAACRKKIAHGSTAPNASGPNRSSEKLPYRMTASDDQDDLVMAAVASFACSAAAKFGVANQLPLITRQGCFG